MKAYAPVLRLSFAGFFAALHVFIISYLHSSVIVERLGEGWVAPLFAGGALLSGLGFLLVSWLLPRLGARYLLLAVSGLEGAATLLLSLQESSLVTALALLAHFALFPLMGFILDFFLERAVVREGATGSARGIFLTSINIALVLSPFLMGELMARSSFSGVYLVSLLALLVFLGSMVRPFRDFTDPRYGVPGPAGLRTAFACVDIAPTALAHLVLRVFYAIAVVYIPLLLISLGFTWEEIGLMLGIALLPFALFELPLGKLADSRFGEKELMVSGFCILTLATIALSLPLPHALWLYALILFATRLGAAFVEITTETHFFRAISSKDINSLTLFRALQPLGYLTGVTLGSVILFFMPLQGAFAAFGILILIGIPLALRISDSR